MTQKALYEARAPLSGVTDVLRNLSGVATMLLQSSGVTLQPSDVTAINESIALILRPGTVIELHVMHGTDHRVLARATIDPDPLPGSVPGPL